MRKFFRKSSALKAQDSRLREHEWGVCPPGGALETKEPGSGGDRSMRNSASRRARN